MGIPIYIGNEMGPVGEEEIEKAHPDIRAVIDAVTGWKPPDRYRITAVNAAVTDQIRKTKGQVSLRIMAKTDPPCPEDPDAWLSCCIHINRNLCGNPTLLSHNIRGWLNGDRGDLLKHARVGVAMPVYEMTWLHDYAPWTAE